MIINENNPIEIPAIEVVARKPTLVSRSDFEKLGKHARAFNRGEIDRSQIPYKFRAHIPKTVEEARAKQWEHHKGEEQFKQITKDLGYDKLGKAYAIGMSSLLSLPVVSVAPEFAKTAYDAYKIYKAAKNFKRLYRLITAASGLYQAYKLGKDANDFLQHKDTREEEVVKNMGDSLRNAVIKFPITEAEKQLKSGTLSPSLKKDGMNLWQSITNVRYDPEKNPFLSDTYGDENNLYNAKNLEFGKMSPLYHPNLDKGIVDSLRTYQTRINKLNSDRSDKFDPLDKTTSWWLNYATPFGLMWNLISK